MRYINIHIKKKARTHHGIIHFIISMFLYNGKRITMYMYEQVTCNKKELWFPISHQGSIDPCSHHGTIHFIIYNYVFLYSATCNIVIISEQLKIYDVGLYSNFLLIFLFILILPVNIQPSDQHSSLYTFQSPWVIQNQVVRIVQLLHMMTVSAQRNAYPFANW